MLTQLLFRHFIPRLLATCLIAFAALPATAQTATYVLDPNYGQWYNNIGSNSVFPFTYTNGTTAGTYTSGDGSIVDILSDLSIAGTGDTPAHIRKYQVADRTVTDFSGLLNDATLNLTDINGAVIDTFTGSLVCSGELYVPGNFTNLNGYVFDSAGKEFAFSYAATSDLPAGIFTATASFVPVPEVSSAVSFGLLAGCGLIGLAWTARKRRAERP